MKNVLYFSVYNNNLNLLAYRKQIEINTVLDPT